jgi:hypothetical protein
MTLRTLAHALARHPAATWIGLRTTDVGLWLTRVGCWLSERGLALSGKGLAGDTMERGE